MRLKLVLAASVLAALVGAGSCIALVLGVFSVKTVVESWSSWRRQHCCCRTRPSSFAAIFVYRHTARRESSRRFLTTLIATLLTLTLLILVSILSNRVRQPDLALHRTQRVNHKANVLVEADAQLFHALTNVVAIHGSRKRFVFQFLLHRRDFEIVEDCASV
jgi:hypothetical protein